MNVTSLGDDRYEVTIDGRRTLAYAIRRGHETWVFVEGRVWVIDARGPSTRRGKQHDEAALSAPMPATVVAINVAVGQAVKAGDTLVVLEAMKMEMAVTAPHDGTVRAIACRVSELVQPGVPLVELE